MLLKQIVSIRWLWIVVNKLHVSEYQVKDFDWEDGKADILRVSSEVHFVGTIHRKIDSTVLIVLLISLLIIRNVLWNVVLVHVYLVIQIQLIIILVKVVLCLDFGKLFED